MINFRNLKTTKDANEDFKELIGIAEERHPLNLAKQFKLVRGYTPGPCFDKFCKVKGLSEEQQIELEKLIT